MSWITDIAGLAKQLITIETRVKDNTDDIKDLQQELKELTKFTQKVAVMVERYQTTADSKHDLLIAQLQNELLKLENKMLLAGQNRRNDAGDLPPDSAN